MEERPELRTGGSGHNVLCPYKGKNGEERREELAGGSEGDAEFFEFGAGAAVFFGAGIALDDFAELADAAGFLAEFDEGHAFLEASRGELEALGIIVENLFVFGDGDFVIFLRVGDFSEIELGVGSEVGVAVILEVVLEFGASEIVFAAGNVAEAVGVEGVCRWGARGNGGGVRRETARASGSGGARGRWGGRGAAGDFGVETLDGILKIDELLIELAKSRLDFLEVVRETLDLCGHGIETRAGIGLHVLDGFLERAHGGGELVDVVAGLLNERLHDGVVLSHLGGKILLTLEQGGYVALKLDEFAGDGFGGAGTDQASSKRTGQNGGAKNGDVTNTHEQSS